LLVKIKIIFLQHTHLLQ